MSSLTTPYSGWTVEVRQLAHLAWPVVLSMLAAKAMGIVDTIMVGHLGEQALAGLGAANIWGWSIVILAQGILRGLDPLFTQAFGAQAHARAGRDLAHGFGVATVLAIPVMVFHGFAGPGLAMLRQPPSALPIASAYCLALIPGIVPMLWATVVRRYVQAQGLMRPHLVAVIIANVANVFLNWVLIYGGLGFPALGAVGSGIATSLCQMLQLGILGWLVWDELRAHWPGWSVVFEAKPIQRLIVVGLPVGIQVSVETYAFLATGVLMGLFGERALAANTIAINLAAVAFMVPYGISTATTTRVGNLVGASLDWGRSAMVAVSSGGLATALAAVIFFVWPTQVAGIYTRDPDVLAATLMLIPIAGAFQVFDGVQGVAAGVLRAVGDLKVPAAMNVVAFWILGIPGGAILAFGLGIGPRGVWLGLAGGLLAVSVMLVVRIGLLARRGVVQFTPP